MKRALTRREKGLLALLAALLLIFGCWKLAWEPVNRQIADYQRETLRLQAQADQALQKLLQMQKMEKTLEELLAAGAYREFPEYDNQAEVLRELQKLLGQTEAVSLEFESLQRQEGMVLRPVSLRFTANSYADALAVVRGLQESGNVNTISSLLLRWQEEKLLVSLQLTYYEKE